MAAKSGSIGRSSEQDKRKPPIPTFKKPKPPEHRLKDQAYDKHSDGSKSGDSSDADIPQVKSEIKPDPPSHSTLHHRSNTPGKTAPGRGEPKPSSTKEKGGGGEDGSGSGSGGKVETDPLKKPSVRAIVIPSRYMSKATPRPTTTTDKKPSPKTTTGTTTTTTTTTTTQLRTKTPERNTHVPERNAKTPTKTHPATPRTTTTTTATVVRRNVSSAPTTRKVVPPTPGKDAPKRIGTATAKQPATARQQDPTHAPPQTKEEMIKQLNMQIAQLQSQLKERTLERDSLQFLSQSEGSEMSDWDDMSGSIDGASENSSELGDERDEKYIDMVKRYRSTLSTLSQKINLMKTALLEARGEYDALQKQHNSLLLSIDMDKMKIGADVMAMS